MEVCQVLPKLKLFIYFCQNYGVMSSFVEIKDIYLFMPKLWSCQILSKLNILIYFWQIYGVMSSFQN